MSDEYPEHHRLGLVAETSHEIGQFIDWLVEKGMCIAEMDREYGQFWPRVGSIESLLADYFEIDLKEIEREKRAMLDGIRAMNEAGQRPKEFDGEPVRDKPCSECP